MYGSSAGRVLLISGRSPGIHFFSASVIRSQSVG